MENADEDTGLRQRRDVSDIPILQRCYLWDPYASNQEVSRSFSNFSSFCDSENSPPPPIFTPCNNSLLPASRTSTTCSMPIINFTFPEPSPFASAQRHYSQTPAVGIRPLYAPSPPPLPNDTPRSMDEYAKLLPISMCNTSFFNSSISKIFY